ncbi:MAG: uncharacterized protein KVP18_002463 [Porospora cf. gigantea A]|uniref:uncharacterized protein n=1 Tax=Porospora cf. gigantea A TaxID=2853593 RepID=UPI00355A6BCE|nr:MAG: hypothetical protein KVP18_002463 [Porospora cf. gigantea A]
MPRILLTGGCGYIASHTALDLLSHGYDVTVLDNLSNSSVVALERVKELSGKDIEFEKVDVRDRQALFALFQRTKFDGVVHFAALKAVGESVANPLTYYENNMTGAINLLQAMQAHGVKTFVFSSSATVYQPKETLLNENDPLGASNPYGHTKVWIEQMLQDLFTADKEWRISILRYFNPVGCHPSGRIGESPDQPMNLLPYIQQVAVGRKDSLKVFGNDWPTRDGTGVRDYIHVQDLSEGHVVSLNVLRKQTEGCCLVHNLGSGEGVSVIEMAEIFEKTSGVKIPYEIVGRRAGDLATVVADPSKAESEWGWKTTHTIEEACSSAWKWQSENPYGYEDKKN